MKKLLFAFFALFIIPFSAQEFRNEFKKVIKEEVKLNYILDIPEGEENYPLILFLHGAGERGTDLEKVKAHSPFTYKKLIKEKVAILAAMSGRNLLGHESRLRIIARNYQKISG